MDLSIIVPAYNEEQRIAPTLERLARFLTAHPVSFEIIVVTSLFQARSMR